MAKHHDAHGKQRNNVGRRVSALEREVKGMTKTLPPQTGRCRRSSSDEGRETVVPAYNPR
jgi:hypothetical protein